MENPQISQLAQVLRSTCKSENTIFSISTKLLEVLNAQFDAHIESSEFMTSSFNIITGANILRNDFYLDLQYIYNYIKHSKTLKLFNEDETDINIDISKFKNIKLLELHQINVNSIKGLQKLRTKLHTLVFCRSNGSLSDLLMKCGEDKTAFIWTELKELSFIDNGLKELDSSLECIPWVQTIDLSRNEIENIEILHLLHNLKNLNLSYNKLETIQPFKGPITTHLQNLIIKNNFIENINGLQCLTNLCFIDLSNNCLIDHKCLVSISQIATLQWLNLTGNPLYFHPQHRNLTASYLHNNIKNAPFVLDGTPLEKTYRKFIGTLHPMQLKISSSFTSDSINLSSEKSRRVRHVVIEDESFSKTKIEPFSIPQYHLDTKRQIEDLRNQFGSSWLQSDSGLAVQNVLGLVNSNSRSTPCDEADLSSLDFNSIGSSSPPQQLDINLSKESTEINGEQADDTKTSFITAYDNSIKEPEQSEPISDDDDIDLDGEENIYLAIPNGATDQIFLVITKTHFSERESSTSKERERWHINSIKKCERLDDSMKVSLEFETMRKDRQQRIYEMEEDEIETFMASIEKRIALRTVQNTKTNYQCMKCSTKFIRKEKISINESSIPCPNCNSTLVVEDL